MEESHFLGDALNSLFQPRMGSRPLCQNNDNLPHLGQHSLAREFLAAALPKGCRITPTLIDEMQRRKGQAYRRVPKSVYCRRIGLEPFLPKVRGTMGIFDAGRKNRRVTFSLARVSVCPLTVRLKDSGSRTALLIAMLSGRFYCSRLVVPCTKGILSITSHILRNRQLAMCVPAGNVCSPVP